jgi:hypothetical protein
MGMRTYTTYHIGDGHNTEYTVNHNLGSTNVMVSAYEDDGQYVMLHAEPITDNSVRIKFWSAPDGGDLTLEITTP